VLELPLDVSQKRAGPESEQGRVHPGPPQLLLHEDQPGEGVLGGANAAGGLEAHLHASALPVGPDGPDHGDPDGERGVDGLLAGGRLHEIGAGHHADQAGLVDVSEASELTGGEDGLDVGVAAGVPEGAYLVVERLPIAQEHVGARDDDVDLAGARLDRCPDLGQPLLEGVQARRKARRDRCDRDRRSPQRRHGGLHHGVVHADGGGREAKLRDAQALEDVRANGPAGLGAEPAYPSGRVVA
jgi:hypothetical protein